MSENFVTEEKPENQFILRLPLKEANKVKKYLATKPKKIKKLLNISLDAETHTGEVKLKNKEIPMVLVDLPTITESLKTDNGKTFIKTADICQMLLPATDAEMYGVSKENNFRWPHGLTPPLKNAKHKRFRKVMRNTNSMDTSEIDKELKWLLKMDNEAVEVHWELIDDPNAKPEKTEEVYISGYQDEQDLFGEISDSNEEEILPMSLRTNQDSPDDSERLVEDDDEY